MTETLDPDGAMASWATPGLAEAGHEALPLPTQELVPLLGADGLGALILAVAREWRPDLVLLCPPYDHVGRRTLHGLHALGVRPVAFAFDEPLFSDARYAVEPANWADYAHVFVAAPEVAERLCRKGVRASWLRWASSLAAFGTAAAGDGLRDRVLLVGRPYARRVELLAELSRRGLPLRVHGHGWWAHADVLRGVELGGPLSGLAMHEALRTAGAVITTGDWEDQPVAMVKYRLLEAAFSGARQVAQFSPDLRAYFSAEEVPHYESAEDLAHTLADILEHPKAASERAARAHRRALAEHTWQTRFVELLSALGVSATREQPSSPPSAYLVGLSLIAHDAERRGALALAREAFRRWAALTDDPTPEAGLARIALAEADTGRLTFHAAQALAKHARDPRNADGLYATLPTQVGTGLGAVGYLDPRPEYLALELSARIALDPVDAIAFMTSLLPKPDLIVATAAILVPTPSPDEARAWRCLFEWALAASPIAHAHLQRDHAARWRSHLRDIDELNPPC